MKAFPQIFGILNVTPDSFSDGGIFFDKKTAINHALKMIDEGADVIDIGGESTRPGALEVSIEDEIQRTIPIIKELKSIRPDIRISIDTTKYEVAKQALDLGAEFINDISGLKAEPRFADLATEYDSSLILMHMLGTPRTMQVNPEYGDVLKEIYLFLETQINLAKSKGVNKVIIDYGIGFGKSLEHNLTLLKNSNHFKKLNVPLLVGLSRKSFINKLLNIENPLERDIPTLIYHTLMLSQDIDYIRVHNVKNIITLREITQKF